VSGKTPTARLRRNRQRRDQDLTEGAGYNEEIGKMFVDRGPWAPRRGKKPRHGRGDASQLSTSSGDATQMSSWRAPRTITRYRVSQNKRPRATNDRATSRSPRPHNASDRAHPGGLTREDAREKLSRQVVGAEPPHRRATKRANVRRRTVQAGSWIGQTILGRAAGKRDFGRGSGTW